MNSKLSTYKKLLKSIVKLEKPIKLAQKRNFYETQIVKLKYVLLNNPSIDNNDTTRKIVKLEQDLKSISNDKSILFNLDNGALRNIYWKTIKSTPDRNTTSSITKKKKRTILVNPWLDIIQYLQNERQYTKLQNDYTTDASRLTQDEIINKTANRVGLQIPHNL